MVNYEYYENAFGGEKIPIESFDYIAELAEVYLERFTFGRIVEYKENQNRVKSCLCKMSEVIYMLYVENGGKEKKSETTDGYSVTYVTECTDGQDSNALLVEKLYRIADVYLENTGLLYCGA